MPPEPENSEMIESCTRDIEINPDNAGAYNNLGVAHKNAGDFHGAVSAYKKAIDLDPGHVMARINLGNVYVLINMQDEAVAAYRNAIEIAPDRFEPHLALGMLFRRANQYEEALPLLKKVLDLNTQNAEAFLRLADTYNKLDQFDQSIELLNNAIMQKPGDTQLYIHLGYSLLAAEKSNEAFDTFIKALEIEPDNDIALRNLAEVHLLLGHRGKSIETYQKAIDINPHLETAYEKLSRLYFHEKNFSKALEYYETATQNGIKVDKGYLDSIEKGISDIKPSGSWDSSRIVYSIDPDLSQKPEDSAIPELVVFFSCPPEISRAARSNLAAMKRSNPDTPVYLAKNNLSDNKEYRWRNNDQIFFKWFSDNKPAGKRFALIDHDMYCSIDLQEFYKEVLDADVATGAIFKPGTAWPYWREIGRLPDKYQASVTGLVPMAGTLFSRKAMELMSSLVLEIEDVIAELRTGTIATHLGMNIKQFGGNTVTIRELKDHEISKPGLYHMVKHVHKSENDPAC